MQAKAKIVSVSVALLALASTPGCSDECVVGYPESPITTCDTAGTATLSAPASFPPPRAPLQIRYGENCLQEASNPLACTTGFGFSITTAQGQFPDASDIDVHVALPAKLTTGTFALPSKPFAISPAAVGEPIVEVLPSTITVTSASSMGVECTFEINLKTGMGEELTFKGTAQVSHCVTETMCGVL
jgi:hypothetical protein